MNSPLSSSNTKHNSRSSLCLAGLRLTFAAPLSNCWCCQTMAVVVSATFNGLTLCCSSPLSVIHTNSGRHRQRSSKRKTETQTDDAREGERCTCCYSPTRLLYFCRRICVTVLPAYVSEIKNKRANNRER